MTRKRILVVDDEPDFIAVVKAGLADQDFDIEVAYNGVEALEKVKANPPDAIVLDVMMPEKDGYQVCAELKSDEAYEDIPILLLTAVSDHVGASMFSHFQGMGTEADDYLAKPASPETILERLESLLG